MHTHDALPSALSGEPSAPLVKQWHYDALLTWTVGGALATLLWLFVCDFQCAKLSPATTKNLAALPAAQSVLLNAKLKQYSQILQRQPQNRAVYLQRADAFAKLGQSEAAVNDYLQVMQWHSPRHTVAKGSEPPRMTIKASAQ